MDGGGLIIGLDQEQPRPQSSRSITPAGQPYKMLSAARGAGWLLDCPGATWPEFFCVVLLPAQNRDVRGDNRDAEFGAEFFVNNSYARGLGGGQKNWPRRRILSVFHAESQSTRRRRSTPDLVVIRGKRGRNNSSAEVNAQAVAAFRV